MSALCAAGILQYSQGIWWIGEAVVLQLGSKSMKIRGEVPSSVLDLMQLLKCVNRETIHFTGQEKSLFILVIVLIRNISVISTELHQQEGGVRDSALSLCSLDYLCPEEMNRAHNLLLTPGLKLGPQSQSQLEDKYQILTRPVLLRNKLN